MANFYVTYPAVSLAPSPIEILLNGVPTSVSLDTVTPANTVPVPVIQTNGSGVATPGATEATQLLVKADADAIKTSTAASAVSEASIDSKTPALVSGSVPVIGPLTDAQLRATAVPISAASLPLPTGAATETSLNALNTKVTVVNTGAVTISTSLPVGAAVIGQVSINQATPGSTNRVSIGTDGVVGISGTVPLPTGAATSALQSSGNTLLGDIDSYIQAVNAKTPVLGAAATAASSPVNIASDQVVNIKPTVAGAVTVKQAAVAVGTSAVRITTDGAVPSATRQRLNFMVDPGSSANFWYGSSSVTASGSNRGVPAFPGASQEWVNDANDYYIISDTTAQVVFVTEAE